MREVIARRDMARLAELVGALTDDASVEQTNRSRWGLLLPVLLAVWRWTLPAGAARLKQRRKTFKKKVVAEVPAAAGVAAVLVILLALYDKFGIICSDG